MHDTQYERDLQAEAEAFITTGIYRLELYLHHHAQFDQWLTEHPAPGTDPAPPNKKSPSDSKPSPTTSPNRRNP